MDGGSSTTTTNIIPPELKDLYIKTAGNMGTMQDEYPLTGFMDPNVRQTADLSNLEKGAAKLVPQLWDEPPGAVPARDMMKSTWDKQNRTYGDARSIYQDSKRMLHGAAPQAGKTESTINFTRQLADKRVKGDADSIANDAALKAAQAAFTATAMPEIGSKMSAMGLGRSSEHGKLLADTWNKMATPHIQDALAREERVIDRKLANAQQNVQNRLNLGKYVSDRQLGLLGAETAGIGAMNAASQLGLGAAGALSDASNQRWQQMKGAIDTGMGVGGVQRGVENDAYKAEYEDFLRRQGMAEKALYAPFGQAGNLVGSRTSSSGK